MTFEKAKASTSAKTSANAKTSVKGGGKTNQRTPFLFLIHIHQVKMTLTKTETKKRTAIYAGLKPAYMAVL